MKVSYEELRQLRAMLTAHRLKHELLVTKMQVLREECQELRTKIRKGEGFDLGLQAGPELL